MDAQAHRDNKVEKVLLLEAAPKDLNFLGSIVVQLSIKE